MQNGIDMRPRASGTDKNKMVLHSNEGLTSEK